METEITKAETVGRNKFSIFRLIIRLWWMTLCLKNSFSAHIQQPTHTRPVSVPLHNHTQYAMKAEQTVFHWHISFQRKNLWKLDSTTSWSHGRTLRDQFFKRPYVLITRRNIRLEARGRPSKNLHYRLNNRFNIMVRVRQSRTETDTFTSSDFTS